MRRHRYPWVAGAGAALLAVGCGCQARNPLAPGVPPLADYVARMGKGVPDGGAAATATVAGGRLAGDTLWLDVLVRAESRDRSESLALGLTKRLLGATASVELAGNDAKPGRLQPAELSLGDAADARLLCPQYTLIDAGGAAFTVQPVPFRAADLALGEYIVRLKLAEPSWTPSELRVAEESRVCVRAVPEAPHRRRGE